MQWQNFSLFNLGVASPLASPAGSLSTAPTGPGSAFGRLCARNTALPPGVSILWPNGSASIQHGKEKKP